MFYRKAGNLSEYDYFSFGKPDYILSPNHLRFFDDLLRFAVENQAVWSACIKKGDLSNFDPKFYYYKIDDRKIISAEINDFNLYDHSPDGIHFTEFIMILLLVPQRIKGQYWGSGRSNKAIEGMLEKAVLSYSSELIGELFVIKDVLVQYNRGNCQIWSRNRKNISELISKIDSNLLLEWRFIHQGVTGSHEVGSLCADLDLPLPESTFPECNDNYNRDIFTIKYK